MHHEHGAQWAQHFRRPVSDLGRFLEREVVPRVYSGRLVVTGSASTVDALGRLGVPAEAIRLITIGVDCPTPKWEPSPTPLFLALGRLVPHKRIDVLLRAWREVEQFTGGRLVVAGDGPALEAVRHLATPSVEFTGLISEAEKQRLLEQAWLLVHTAQHEGWGMVVMEAAAVGTPALAFDVDGVRDSVAHGSTGVLVEEVDELVAAWIALRGRRERREALGIAARVRATTFSWGTAADEFEAIALEACPRRLVEQPPVAMKRIGRRSDAVDEDRALSRIEWRSDAVDEDRALSRIEWRSDAVDDGAASSRIEWRTDEVNGGAASSRIEWRSDDVNGTRTSTRIEWHADPLHVPPEPATAATTVAVPTRTTSRVPLVLLAVGFVLSTVLATFVAGGTRYVQDTSFEFDWNPAGLFAKYLSVWDASRGLGDANPSFDTVLSVVSAVFREAGFGPTVSQRLVHTLLLSVAGLGAVMVLRRWRPKIGPEHVAMGLAYMFNPFTATFLFPATLFLDSALAPWFLFAFLVGVQAARRWRWAAVFALLVFAAGWSERARAGLVDAAAARSRRSTSCTWSGPRHGARSARGSSAPGS